MGVFNVKKSQKLQKLFPRKQVAGSIQGVAKVSLPGHSTTKFFILEQLRGFSSVESLATQAKFGTHPLRSFGIWYSSMHKNEVLH